MNKNGSGNIFFILLVPVFIVVSLLVVDTIISYSTEKNYKKITEKIVTEVVNNEDILYEEYYDEIKRLYEFDGYDTEMLIVDANEYEIYIENEHKYHGLFSSIFGVGEVEDVKLFGIIDFKMKKASKVSIKLEVNFDQDDNMQFEYVLE